MSHLRQGPRKRLALAVCVCHVYKYNSSVTPTVRIDETHQVTAGVYKSPGIVERDLLTHNGTGSPLEEPCDSQKREQILTHSYPTGVPRLPHRVLLVHKLLLILLLVIVVPRFLEFPLPLPESVSSLFTFKRHPGRLTILIRFFHFNDFFIQLINHLTIQQRFRLHVDTLESSLHSQNVCFFLNIK